MLFLLFNMWQSYLALLRQTSSILSFTNTILSFCISSWFCERTNVLSVFLMLFEFAGLPVKDADRVYWGEGKFSGYNIHLSLYIIWWKLYFVLLSRAKV